VAKAPGTGSLSDQDGRCSIGIVPSTGPACFDQVIAEWIPPGSDVLIVDVPVNRNVGDLFILAATHALLQRLQCRIVYAAGVRDYRTARARRAATPNAIIVGLGGGNFGDLYPRYQGLRERVVADFPDRRVVVLPQTMHFRDPRALDRTVSLLGRHHNLYIAARDPGSADIARHITPNVRLLPDIVDATSAALASKANERARRLELSSHLRDEQVLYLLRRDREGGGAPPMNGIDWPDLFPRFHRRLALMALLLPTAPLPLARRLHGAWTRYASTLLSDGCRLFEQANRVVTDRLHGAILARLAGRPVTLHDNSYGKLAAYYRAWWSADPTMTLQDRPSSR
jgi:pyruvyl transferase EpsO